MSLSNNKVLLTPTRIGEIEINNRLVVAPLTRCRAPNRVPNALMQTYYSQRASFGLILTEATVISSGAVGYKDTPGLWSEEQEREWKKIVDAVHAKGGKIVVQLWHVGRISHPTFLSGQTPIAPSAVKPKGLVSHLQQREEFVIPRALELEEIAQVVKDYVSASQRAWRCGFDGVEIHAANGYLIEQFLSTNVNLRQDRYGGSLENRQRFLLDILKGVCEIWPSGRVGVHLSPRQDAHDIYSEDRRERY
jgi:2,4-dienoyl-CoA reductase-like NADH-dependent reductase (Old Yellow Enzyme family)